MQNSVLHLFANKILTSSLKLQPLNSALTKNFVLHLFAWKWTVRINQSGHRHWEQNRTEKNLPLLIPGAPTPNIYGPAACRRGLQFPSFFFFPPSKDKSFYLSPARPYVSLSIRISKAQFLNATDSVASSKIALRSWFLLELIEGFFFEGWLGETEKKLPRHRRFRFPSRSNCLNGLTGNPSTSSYVLRTSILLTLNVSREGRLSLFSHVTPSSYFTALKRSI